jgi:hypothetical protein
VAKISLGADFDSLTSFLEYEIIKWPTNFIINNVEHNSIAREQHVKLSDIENEIFSLRVKE